jgi:hypothetical protein
MALESLAEIPLIPARREPSRRVDGGFDFHDAAVPHGERDHRKQPSLRER